MCVYLVACLSGCVSVWMCVSLDVCLPGCVSVWMCVSLDVCLYGCVSVMDVCLSGCVSVWMCVCLDVCLSVFGPAFDSRADRAETSCDRRTIYDWRQRKTVVKGGRERLRRKPFMTGIRAPLGG